MSKSKDIQEQLNKKAGVQTTVKESNHAVKDREILDIKLRLEKVQNRINEIKGVPRRSPILSQTLQEGLDKGAGVKKSKYKIEKSSYADLEESVNSVIKKQAGC